MASDSEVDEQEVKGLWTADEDLELSRLQV
jgi:hypothetical protein